jgi:hypothetical protein
MTDNPVIQARIEEIAGIVNGLLQTEGELRQSAATGLGRMDGLVFANLTGQAQMLASLRQGLIARMDVLQKQRDEPQPEQLNSRRRRAPLASVPPQPDGVDD